MPPREDLRKLTLDELRERIHRHEDPSEEEEGGVCGQGGRAGEWRADVDECEDR